MYDGASDILAAWREGMRPERAIVLRSVSVDPAIRAMLSKYPLPDSVTDAVLNRTQLAFALETSENTITKWHARGMPCRQEGSNGRDYQFQLSHCFAWLMQTRAAEDAARRDAEESAAQMRLVFQNLDEDDAEQQGHLTPDQIAKIAEADYKRNRAAELRGDLVRVDRVRSLQERQLNDLRQAVMSLPDFAEQEFGLTPAQAEKMQHRCESMLSEVSLTLRQHLPEHIASELTHLGAPEQESLL